MFEENDCLSHIAVVIPALEPNRKLIKYVNDLRSSGLTTVIVIDDGSGSAYQDIFDSLEATVLHHNDNKGKGAALKTGFSYIQKNLPFVEGVITVDSDGQHTREDCIRLVKKMDEVEEGTLLLGARDFNLPNIPPKSRGGNKITSLIFKLLYGQYLQDTQTGLRAFSASLLPFMLAEKGDRFEYEMKVLISCSRANVPIVSVPIATVYDNNNEGTHFHPIKDSWRIYKVIFGCFFKFMASSLVSMLVDQGLFNFLNLVIFSNGVAKNGRFILAATVIARIISACLNYTLNYSIVFNSNNKENFRMAFGRYVFLCVTIMLLSAGGTWLFSIAGMSSTVAKLVTDTMLYYVSYRAQEQWVFRKK